MQYRTFGKTGFQASALGFGCMRLPKTASGEIDEPLAGEMLAYGIEHGVNYLDTGYGYHKGESERFLGRFLKEGYRQRVKLATKLPCWAVNGPDDFDRLLNEQLQKLQTDHIDFYLLHGLRRERWDSVRRFGVQDFLDRALADGRIGGAGFSFHDNLAMFKEVIDSYHWDMCQIQYNYMNETVQAGTDGLHYAAAKGLAVVVMEPLLGGRLAAPPAPVAEIWRNSGSKRSPVEWALQWLWTKPEVAVALSGMTAMQHVIDNVEYAERSCVNSLGPDEIAVVAQARAQYEALTPVPCTACGYCMPCPNGVDVPRALSTLNAGIMYGDLEDARRRYQMIPPGQSSDILASSCIACLECEDKCPQKIPISQWMPYVHAILAEGRHYVAAERPPVRQD